MSAGHEAVEDAGKAWMAHMRRGDFAAAWRVSDDVLRGRGCESCAHLPRHEQWVWNGAPVDGKRVLVRCYHGLGDTLQFIRFTAPLREVAREVTVWAQPELIPLLSTARGVDRLIPLHDGAPDADFDVDVEVMELSHLFRCTPGTLPGEVPYLQAEPAPIERDGRLAVGVVWRAGDWDERRSVPAGLLAPLAALPGVALHILQRGAALDECLADLGIHSGSDDVLRTARVMKALDLVISVDSMPAHLAGALGVPVWTLLHADPDWRWMQGRDDSPWYPTMRLFRQQRAGDWEGVLARVVAELAKLAARGHRHRQPVPR